MSGVNSRGSIETVTRPRIPFWKTTLDRHPGIIRSGATQSAHTPAPIATLVIRCGADVGRIRREKISIDAATTASLAISFHGFASGMCVSRSSHAAKTTNGPTHAIVREVGGGEEAAAGGETGAAWASVSVIAAEYSTARRATALSCP